jgi:uncharacterized protein
MSPTLLFGIVGASLVGSLHCAGMCGPFVAFYAGGDTSHGRGRALSHLAYHAGRLVTYTLLGAIAGSIGAAIDLAGSAAGVGRVAGVIAGLVMVAWGAVLLLRAGGVPIGRILPARLTARASCSLARLKERPPIARALLIGLASTLLPCGWLYAFVVMAAGTGSALGGAMLMLAFWAGTVPLLLGLGVGVQRISHHLRRHVPIISALVLVVLGVAGVATRLHAEPFQEKPCSHCHTR